MEKYRMLLLPLYSIALTIFNTVIFVLSKKIKLGIFYEVGVIEIASRNLSLIIVFVLISLLLIGLLKSIYLHLKQ